MAEIIDFGGGHKRSDFDPDATLDSLKGKLQGFVLVGYDHDNNEVTAITFGHLARSLVGFGARQEINLGESRC
jgi:hypothetical protein